MAGLAFILFWVFVGLVLTIVALSGGPAQARESLYRSQSRHSRRVASGIFAAALVVLGIAIPVVVLAANHTQRTVRNEGLALTPSQEHGRQLFGITCGQCHKLAAAHTAGRIGPDLDKLKPNTPLVLDAIQRGRARGIGRMPAGLYRGKDAQDIASFVNRTAGRQ